MIIKIIEEHLKKYPQMEICDIIKLIYQNEFGGGHLIKDAQASLAFLREECIGLNQNKIESEDIGNGLVRVYLANLNELQLVTLNQLFVLSAKLTKGSLASFVEKLEELKEASKNGQIALNYKNLCQEINQYEQQNYPAISHSKKYRQLYQPHYRVINKQIYQYFEIVFKINELLLTKDHLMIAIDGNCAAGKSTLAKYLQMIFDANVFKMDDFFLQPFQRTKERLEIPGGNVDYERFKKTVIDSLLQGKEVNYQCFDCSKMALDDQITIIPYRKINIIEGTYSMHPYFKACYDFKIGLKVSSQVQEERILKRNGNIMLKKFKEIWIPLENKYFDEDKVFKHVDYLKQSR